MKKIIYIDMDSVLCDFLGHAQELGLEPGKAKHVDGFFRDIKPVPGAVEAFEKLSKLYDVYILTTAPWHNPSAWTDKLIWVQKYLPDVAYKRLIISHHKNLCTGDYLIDDTCHNGAGSFKGELIQFGSEGYPSWPAVVSYLETEAKRDFEAYLDSRTYCTKGTIDDLMAVIAKNNLLAPDEEREAIKKAQKGDRTALEDLIAENMRFCVSIANIYKNKDHDLIELVKLAERSVADSVMSFNPQSSGEFKIYMASEMHQKLRSATGITKDI